MFRNLIYVILFLANVHFIFSNDVEYIRTYDLGGQGLKTALLRYDRNTQCMDWIETKAQLGQCPDDMKVCDWIRLRMKEVLSKDLDEEINAGYLFGFSVSGLNKLRSKALSNCDISVLFNVRPDRTRCIDLSMLLERSTSRAYESGDKSPHSKIRIFHSLEGMTRLEALSCSL